MKFFFGLVSLLAFASTSYGWSQDVHCVDASRYTTYRIHFSELDLPTAKAKVTVEQGDQATTWLLEGLFYMSYDMDLKKEFNGFVINFDPNDYTEKKTIRTHFFNHESEGHILVKNADITGFDKVVKVPCTQKENL